jgi:hypothetical protein
MGRQKPAALVDFCFENDVWDLRLFCESTQRRNLNFQSIEPK